MSTLFFLDTEFSSFEKDKKLISLALLPEHGDEFCYVELPFSNTEVTEFVKRNVTPQLFLVPGAQCRRPEAAQRIANFLKSADEIIICCDYDGDRDLLCTLLHEENFSMKFRILLIGNILGHPAYIAASNDVFQRGAFKQHHALADCAAMRAGFLAARSALNDAFGGAE